MNRILKNLKAALICILCPMLLLCGCSSAANKAAVSFPAQPTDAAHPQAAAAAPAQPAEPADSVTLSIAEDPADASPAAPAPASAVSSGDPREEVPVLLSARQEEACTIGVTRILREKNEDGTWTHTYFNKDVDFTGLGLEVLQYSFTGDTPALRLKVTFPEHWDSDTRAWMQKEGLKLSFRMGGLPVDAYRQRSITPLEDGFLVEYARCLLTEEDYAAYKGLYICPYVEQYTGISRYDHTAHMLTDMTDLTKGEVFSTVYRGVHYIMDDYLMNMNFSRIDLSNIKLSIPFPQTEYRNRTPVYSPLAVIEPLWEENIKSGVYDEGTQIPERVKISLINKDFSEVRFVLDTFHIWEEEFLLVYSVYFPDSWSLYERNSILEESGLGLTIDLDGTRQSFKQSSSTGSSPQYFFGNKGQRGFTQEIHLSMDYSNYATIKISCQHYRNWYSNLSVVEWSQKKNLKFIPSYRSHINAASMDVSTFQTGPTISLSETPVIINGHFGDREVYLLEELAIFVDITPDLFDCGF